MRRWLRRRGFLDEQREEDRSNEAPSQSPLKACMQMPLLGSIYLRLARDGAAVPLAVGSKDSAQLIPPEQFTPPLAGRV